MFNIIEGGFQMTIQGLFTVDFSWLFVSMALIITDIFMVVNKVYKSIRGKIGSNKTVLDKTRQHKI